MTETKDVGTIVDIPGHGKCIRPAGTVHNRCNGCMFWVNQQGCDLLHASISPHGYGCIYRPVEEL